MFGYVRPVKDELKGKDFNLYRASYCGLCRTLRTRYGYFAPYTLSFEFTFLALLLAPREDVFLPCKGACHANPLRKEAMCNESESLNFVADLSIILSYQKLLDNIADNKGIKAIAARTACLFLKSAFKKAEKNQPHFAAHTKQCLTELATLEKSNSDSLDKTADAFARIVSAAAQCGSEHEIRPLEQMLYHLGRWIYLIDARDDLAQDLLQKNYNPIIYRYGQQGDDDALNETLVQSLSMMQSAFALCDFGCRTAVIENIIFLGLPVVQKLVFEDKWTQVKKQKIWSSRR